MRRILAVITLVTTFALFFETMPAFAWTTSREAPEKIEDDAYRFGAFSNGEVLLNKRQGRLPAMGWNSWNAFGSGNTEALTMSMADSFVSLGLDKLGYEYIVLDDGCYNSSRVNGLLSNNTTRFPSGFRALSDYIHSKGLKFGMYNDIGTNLCAGAAVGTAGYEEADAKTYLNWGVDFLKVDNCYYLWDNATNSAKTNAKYSYAPNIRAVTVSGNGYSNTLNAVSDGTLTGAGAQKNTSGNYVTNIGTFDGTNVGTTPVGDMSGELTFTLNAPTEGDYSLTVNYAGGEEAGCGRWLQVAVDEELFFDDLLPKSSSITAFGDSAAITIHLNAGANTLRLMNHRRQENTLQSYSAFLDSLNKADTNHDVYLSICEWGKTQPQNWAYKVGNSWRVLNDITFSLGNTSGGVGSGAWSSSNTASITSQYNKAVIMDEFAGLDKGWNDPDMLTIGMSGITNTMAKTHMSMWCMMNSPLMLGMDLRRIKKGDEMWSIIANGDMIALNQDAKGVQAKRIYTTAASSKPDGDYITDNNRVDILAKPLAGGDVALSFINLSGSEKTDVYAVDAERIVKYIGFKMENGTSFKTAAKYYVKNMWTKETSLQTEKTFGVGSIAPYDSVTVRISPIVDADDLKTVLREKRNEASDALAKNLGATMPLLAAENAALGEAIASATATLNAQDATLEAVQTQLDALCDARAKFDDAYSLYAKMGAALEKSADMERQSAKYVQNEAWTSFIAQMGAAQNAYASAQSVDALNNAYSALMAAKAAVSRNLGDGLNPVAWYIFDGEGTTVRDVSGSGNDAELFNSGASMSDEVLTLNAQNENNGYMKLPASVTPSGSSFTFSAWVKNDEYRSWARIFDFGMSSTNGYMFLCPSTGSAMKCAVTKSGSSAEQSFTASRPEVGKWVHIALVQSGTAVTLYQNGTQSASGTFATSLCDILTASAACYIGKSQFNDPYFKGSMKDIRIYDKALSSAEVSSVMADFAPAITEITPIEVQTRLGKAPILPQSVNVTYEGGATAEAAVTWDDYDSELLYSGKPFGVYGTIEGTVRKAQARVSFASISLDAEFCADAEIIEVEGENYAKVTVANLTDSEKKVRLHLAAYGAEGGLGEIKTVFVTIAPNSYETPSALLFETAPTNLFVWTDNLLPITEPRALEVQKLFWSVVRPEAASVTVNSADNITVNTARGDLWGRSDNSGTAKNIYLIDIPAEKSQSFSIEAAVKFKPNVNYQRAALIIYTGDGNQVSVMRRYHSTYGGNVFMTTMNTNASAASENLYSTDGGNNECRLRLTKIGSAFYGAYSLDDGATWNALETRTQSVIAASDSIRAGFYASNGDIDAASLPVTFENFTLDGEKVSFLNVN